MASERYDYPTGDCHGWLERQRETLYSITVMPAELEGVRANLGSSGRLTEQDGLQLYHHPDLSAVMALADACKRARFGNDVFFNLNLHVNQTNICVLACRFCAFRRGPRALDAYAMDIETYIANIEPFAGLIDEVHSVGGLHPDWTIEHYCDLFKQTKQRFPELYIKALTAIEIKHLARLSAISIEETLSRLRDAGLDSLPGGGAEILVDEVRARICKGKESSQEYLDIHATAHALGMVSNCTMLFGTVETPEDRITHLLRLRTQQDESGGFQCFVPYPFLADASRLPEAQLASANEILRMIAISRLMLDNIPHIKAYRMNIGDHLTQLALTCGADDVDGTVGQETIMHLAGSTTALDHGIDDLCRLISTAGYTAVRRNTIYSKFERIQAITKENKHSLPMAG